MENLSFFLKHVLEGDFAVLNFDPKITSMFHTDCEIATLTLNKMKCEIMRFNPLKTDLEFMQMGTFPFDK